MPMRGEAISVQPPEPILDLVARFERNRDSYLAGGINETQLRQESIDPFFISDMILVMQITKTPTLGRAE
jgi:hypothetical protein